MLSRTADHLFWMSRYLERAENLARFLDVGQSLALIAGTAPDADSSAATEPLVITGTLAPFEAAGPARTPEAGAGRGGRACARGGARAIGGKAGVEEASNAWRRVVIGISFVGCNDPKTIPAMVSANEGKP